MSYLKGVLVDFGGTLAYLDDEEDRRFRKEIFSILTKHRYDKTLDEVNPLLDGAYWRSSKGEAKTPPDFWRLFLRILDMPENIQLISELVELQSGRMALMFKLYEGAVEVLSALQKKHKLALVSNCSTGLSEVIEALGLTRFFEVVILSYEVEMRKPDRRIYLETLRKLRLKPDECIFISDEISDLEGAREVGLKTALVRQGDRTAHEAKDPNFKPDFECNRISEVTRLL